jgi:uncharacterized membrane protein YhaH (DUF805 family)
MADQVVNFIKESRSHNKAEDLIYSELIAAGWPKEVVESGFYQLAKEADEKTKNSWWLLKLLRGRLNRIEFLIGILSLFILILSSSILKSTLLETAIQGNTRLFIELVFQGIMIIWYISLLSRRINDLSIARNKYLIIFYLLFGVIFLWYLLLIPGQKKPNEDGLPPKPGIDLRKIFII